MHYNYKLANNVAIDESMVKFIGRSDAMPNKPIKFGYKIFCLAESESSYPIGKSTGVRNIYQTSIFLKWYKNYV